MIPSPFRFSSVILVTLSLAAPQGLTPGLQGEYWGPGTSIPGAPGIPGGSPSLTRVDATVDFSDGTFPAPFAAADAFVVRWTGFVLAPVTGPVTFFTNTDDGVELSVNSQVVITDWQGQAPEDNQAVVAMTQGAWVPIRLTYFEDGGGAECHLSWSYGTQSRVVIPTSNLSVTPPPPPAAPTLSISTAPSSSPVINLSWTAVPNATAYRVLRGSQSGTEATFVTVNAPATGYVDTAVLFQVTYFYVVQAVVGAQVSADSNEVSGRPQALPPRTEKKGSEDEPCGCGTTRRPGTAVLAAGAAALLLLCLRRP
ncbi:MAG: hypothetical protein EHM91_06650 [Planctomycetota bacterium]|nr:MAG: hypothetical protein EHM91_06650 [Planctomycetota bacterium]